jgi:ATP-dependent Clp protease ATP-binding subunit ClpA
VFERFTQEAREVLTRAQDEAREMQHNFIGTEHLLLGLKGTAPAEILERLGAPMDVLHRAVLDVVGRGGEPQTAPPPFTPRAKKVLELSLREALARDDRAIRPEHLLLGLLKERDGVACQVLASAGVGYESVAAAAAVRPVTERGEPVRRFWRRGGIAPPAPPGAHSMLRLEGENFSITPEQAEQIRRYLAGGPPPLPPSGLPDVPPEV